MLARVLAVLLLAAPLAAAEPPTVTLALVGGQIVDGYEGKPIVDGVILIAGERIAALGPRAQVPVPADVATIVVAPRIAKLRA